MTRISLVNTAQQLVASHIKPGDIAIDATLGNGHDCLFLAQHVGNTGKVFGFDIQPAAIVASQARCQQANVQAELIHASHADMHQHIPKQYHGQVNVIMFNLGYLPGGDKTLITQSASTLTALSSASQLLATSGLMTIMAYPGHAGGGQETEQVKHWCQQLDAAMFTTDIICAQEHKERAPRLFVVKKLHK